MVVVAEILAVIYEVPVACQDVFWGHSLQVEPFYVSSHQALLLHYGLVASDLALQVRIVKTD